MVETDLKKLYYSIGEVSRLLRIDQHVLRYWETEFKELAPSKRKGGKRLYKERDLQTVRLIKKLLYEDRYTIEGARRKLGDVNRTKIERADHVKTDETVAKTDIIREVRKDLLELKAIMDS